MTSESMRRAGANGLVVLQMLLLAALIVESALPGDSFIPWWPRTALVLIVVGVLIIVGLVMAVWGILGLGPALTASPIPKKHAQLVTHGPYALVRNPIYTGLMIIGTGLTVSGATWWHVATLAALIILLAVKARWEERMLAAAHPDFAAYAARTGRFLPGIGLWRTPASSDATP